MARLMSASSLQVIRYVILIWLGCRLTDLLRKFQYWAVACFRLCRRYRHSPTQGALKIVRVLANRMRLLEENEENGFLYWHWKFFNLIWEFSIFLRATPNAGPFHLFHLRRWCQLCRKTIWDRLVRLVDLNTVELLKRRHWDGMISI